MESINQEQGTTILVVSHDPRVARRTRRILTMRDGKIVDDHLVESLIKEDLRDLARSRLGELLLEGEKADLLAKMEWTGADGEVAVESLRRLLESVQ
jgi:ABC-type glutathione transport system ATPase component